MIKAFLLLCFVPVLVEATEKPLFYMSADEIYKEPQLVLLAKASARGNVSKMKKLLAEVDVNTLGYQGTPVLFWALQKSNKVGYRTLLQHGTNPNLIFGTSKLHSVMHLSASMADEEWLSMAIDYDGDANLKNAIGSSPLY